MTTAYINAHFPSLSEEEFAEKLRTLREDNSCEKEDTDFPYLGSTINTLLSNIEDFSTTSSSSVDTYMFDMDLFLKLRDVFYGIDIGEARYLFIECMTQYFVDRETVRANGINLNKLS